MRIGIIWLIGLLLAGACLHAEQTVTGTALSASHDRLVISSDDGRSLTVTPEQGAVIMRGQVGKQMRAASLLDFAPGDRIVAVVKQDGTAASIKGFYAIVRGTVRSVSGQTIELDDGSKVRLRQGTEVVFGEGRLGKPTELQPGTLILCRLNPASQEAWTVVATGPPPSSTGTVPAPAQKPVITALKYTGPSPLRVRDWIRVDMEGTPGGRAVFQVKGLIPLTQMKEIEPGKYRASVMIPGGKPVTDAPLIARLSVNGVESEPVQAARLFNIPAVPPAAAVTAKAPIVETPERMPVPEPLPKPSVENRPAAEPQPAPQPEPEPEAVSPEQKPEPPAAAAAEKPQPEAPKTNAAVAIVTPSEGERIKRAIIVRGTAEPDSQVLVTVSYTNCQSGVLNISGKVVSQLVAVNDKGQFAMGPIPLEGPLATRGLVFTIEAAYPDTGGAKPVAVTVFGDRG